MNDWHYQPAKDLGLPARQRYQSLQRESGLIQTSLHLGWWSLLRVYLKGRFRLRVDGREHLPRRPPFVIIANHSSHLDALVLSAALPWRVTHCTFPIAAGDVFFKTPSMAAMSALVMNLLPMWRKNCGPHALAELRQRLVSEEGQTGCGYILFPEGHRSRTGELGDFKAGLGMIVAGADVPVVPCCIEGAFEAWPPDDARPRGGRIRVIVGSPMNFKDLPNRRQSWQQIAATLKSAVTRLRESPPSPE